MPGPAERVINGLHKFLEAHGGAETEEELHELIAQYMQEYNASLPFQPKLSEANAQTSEDWLELAEKAAKRMEELGFLPDDAGDFWQVHGTRPYLRLLSEKMHLEKQCCMYQPVRGKRCLLLVGG